MTRRGFSLLEVMVSSALFLLGVAGVFASFNGASGAFRHLEYQTAAESLADGKLEDLMLLPASALELTAGKHQDVIEFDRHGQPTTQGIFSIEWVVTDGVPVPGMRSVEVRVVWTDDVARELSLTTFRD